MVFEIEFSPKSEDDIRFIIEYYWKLNHSTAKRYYFSIIERTENLTNYPKMGRPVPEFIDTFYDKYREVIFENFRIMYRIEEEKIIIVRVIDGRMLVDPDMI
ncbi:MAG: type II toxin-antitoxin system RelE/ParE family toxin [Spirochaetales bacterium]|nr:type II toxin-antitoxin system RelE/ParE family toxin [Spirochaetales bacterium]